MLSFLCIFRTLPKISKEEFGLIFDELDDTRDFKVEIYEAILRRHKWSGYTLKITYTFLLINVAFFFFSCWADKQGWVRWPLPGHCSKIPKGGSSKSTYILFSCFRNLLSPHHMFTWALLCGSLQPSLFEDFPQIYHSALSQQLRAFVRSPRFSYAISFILVLNFIAVVVETTVYLVPIKCIFFPKFFISHNRFLYAAWYRRKLGSETMAGCRVCLW